MTTYENIIATLKKYEIPYKEFNHAPILSYEDAEREKAVHQWEGTESKNVCLIGGDSSCCVYVTLAGIRVDMKKLKELTGIKYSLANEEELRRCTGCVPGCVAPFGFGEDVLLVIDENVFDVGAYLFSPGMTTKTVQMDAKHLRGIFLELPNQKVYLK